MKLIASPTSPYARKVRIALVEKRIDCEFVEDSPWSPETKATLHNPLGKVPVLVLDDGTSLYDSRVIVEYLDTVSPVSRLIPEPSRQRIAVKRWEALADIAAGCALGYLELRHPDIDWRNAYPNLEKLAEKLSKRQSFQDSAPPQV